MLRILIEHGQYHKLHFGIQTLRPFSLPFDQWDNCGGYHMLSLTVFHINEFHVSSPYQALNTVLQNHLLGTTHTSKKNIQAADHYSENDPDRAVPILTMTSLIPTYKASTFSYMMLADCIPAPTFPSGYMVKCSRGMLRQYSRGTRKAGKSRAQDMIKERLLKLRSYSRRDQQQGRRDKGPRWAFDSLNNPFSMARLYLPITLQIKLHSNPITIKDSACLFLEQGCDVPGPFSYRWFKATLATILILCIDTRVQPCHLGI